MAGTPDQAPEAGGGSAPGTVPAENNQTPGGKEPQKASGESGNKSDKDPQTQVNVKTSAMRKKALGMGGYAALGGLLGGAQGVRAGSEANIAGLKKQIQQMQLERPEGFRAAASLAKAKAELEIAQASQEHPMAAGLMGAAGGAMSGALLGPGLEGQVRRLGHNINTLRG